MLRFAPLAALLALGACATSATIPGQDALSGKDLQSAVNLYGPWSQRIVLDDQPVYIWRRHFKPSGSQVEVYCELRVETGWRDTVSRSQMQGYPAACNLFNIHYTSAMR